MLVEWQSLLAGQQLAIVGLVICHVDAVAIAETHSNSCYYIMCSTLASRVSLVDYVPYDEWHVAPGAVNEETDIDRDW